MTDDQKPEESASDSGFKPSNVFGLVFKTLPTLFRTQLAIALFFLVAGIAWLYFVGSRLHGTIVSVPGIVCFSLFGVAAIPVVLSSIRLVSIDKGDSEIKIAVSDRLAESVSENIADTTQQIAENLAQDVFKEVERALPDTPSWANEGILIGVRFGRHSVTCGAFHISGARTAVLPPASSLRTIQVFETEFDLDAAPDAKVEVAARLIAEVASAAHRAKPKVPIEGIGIGVPGFVEPGEKTIMMSALGLPSATHLVEMIAARLALDETFVDLMGTDHPQEIASVCRLDNDVRCATRFTLSQHLGKPQWENFVSLHLGTGVGAGIVLGGRLYYGRHSWSGEIGHIDLGVPGLSLNIEGKPASLLKPMECTCRDDKKVYHFEALVNYKGLRALAELLNPTMYQSIVSALQEPGVEWNEDQILREAWPALVGSTGKATPLPRVAGTIRSLVKQKDYESYLNSIHHLYAALVAGGMACIVSLFDVDKFVLFGSLYESLKEVGQIDFAIRESLRHRLPVERAVVIDDGSVRDDIWRGAALLARDWQFPPN